MRAKLQITGGSSAGRMIDIKLPQFVIGRATGCHLRLNSDAISRQHCAFLVNDKEVVLKDLGSRNGTFLNGEQLTKAVVLKTGDELQLGPLKFEVIITTDEGKVVPSPSADESAPANAPKDRPSDSGLISDWLLDDEEDGLSTEATDPETRQFKLDESTMMEAPKADPKEDKKRKEKEAKAKKKKQPMKLPESATQPDSDNSQDAAADTLKKLYNRGLS